MCVGKSHHLRVGNLLGDFLEYLTESCEIRMKAFWVAKLDWQPNNKIQLMEHNAATKLLSVVSSDAGKAENSIIAHKRRIKVVLKDGISKWRRRTSPQFHSKANPDKSEMFPANFFHFPLPTSVTRLGNEETKISTASLRNRNFVVGTFRILCSSFERKRCLVKQWPLKLNSCWSTVQLWSKTSWSALDTLSSPFSVERQPCRIRVAGNGQKHCVSNL